MEICIEKDKDALFAAWDADRRSPAPRSLSEWLHDYPDSAADLMQWASDAPLRDQVDTFRYADKEATSRLERLGTNLIAEMRARYSTQPSAPLTSLYARSLECGLTPKQLAAELGIGMPLAAKLQSRLLRAATIPQNFLLSLADKLNVSVQLLRDYLDQSPTLAQGAMYRSNEVPQADEQEDFATALQNCPGMTEEQKAQWK
jgi:hypothetical protein